MLIQPIAEVVEGSLEDYEEGLKACAEASKMWMQVVYTVLCLIFLCFCFCGIYVLNFSTIYVAIF